jgi:hypothetical protein
MRRADKDTSVTGLIRERDEALIAIDVSDVLNPATRQLKTCNWVRK